MIRRSRVLVARTLIDGGVEVKAARLTAGFKGRTDFNRLFKRYIGCTPKDYRDNRERTAMARTQETKLAGALRIA